MFSSSFFCEENETDQIPPTLIRFGNFLTKTLASRLGDERARKVSAENHRTIHQRYQGWNDDFITAE
jgi:hypothetical protein